MDDYKDTNEKKDEFSENNESTSYSGSSNASASDSSNTHNTSGSETYQTSPGVNNDYSSYTQNGYSGYGSSGYHSGQQGGYSAGQTGASQSGTTPAGTTPAGATPADTNPSGAYHSNGSSYTWGTQQGGTNQSSTHQSSAYQAPQYYNTQPPAPKKKKEKKKGKRTFLKVIAAVMCCAVVSVSSVGVFAHMINRGYVDVEGGSTASAGTTPAFTINKVIEDDTKMAAETGSIESQTPQQIAENVIPSIVCIQNYQQSSYYPFGSFGMDSEQDGSDDEVGLSPASEGSGIIYTKDGYIITNAHVISGAAKLKVITSDGMSYEAEEVGSDSITDLAVIRITNADKEFTPAKFGSSEDLKVADEVMAIGNPGGMEFNSSVTMGYISALNRPIADSTTGFSLECIQTDAAINPGNSGGALLNMYGQVIGINSSKIVATGYEGLGFAIPSDTAQPIISDLMEYGYVKDRATIGVSGEYLDSLTARFYRLTEGFCIASVSSENAKNAGLERYDVITAIDNHPITSSQTIYNYILEKKPGDTVTLTVNKSQTGEIVNIDLVLSENTGE